MTAILIKLIEMSLQGSCLIMIILLIRTIWKKIPRKYICYLWYLVSLRLVLPFSFDFIKQSQPANQMEEIISKVATKVIYPLGEPKKYTNGGGWSNAGRRFRLDLQDWQNIIWITVVAIICIYIITSYIITRYRVKEAVYYRDNIYYCENVKTPFLFGYLRPRIYISYHMKEEDICYIEEHEKMHLKRLDHFSKLIGVLFVAVYWFNPIIWLGFRAFCEDMEYACDEMVIQKMGKDHKKGYSKTLLDFSIERCMEVAPLGKCCFSDVHVKSRIKRVLEYKSVKPFAIVIFVIMCVTFMVFGFVGQYNVNALLKVPIKGYDLYFGMTKQEVDAKLEGLSYEVFTYEGSDHKYTYKLDGRFKTEFGTCKRIELYVVDYGDLLPDMEGNPLEYGLERVMLGYEEGKTVYYDHMLKKLERYYGKLEGGVTEVGTLLKNSNDKIFYNTYYSEKWNVNTFPDIKDTFEFWYKMRGINNLPHFINDAYMNIVVRGTDGEAVAVDIQPYYLVLYLKLKGLY